MKSFKDGRKGDAAKKPKPSKDSDDGDADDVTLERPKLKKNKGEVIEPEFDNSKLQNGQLEYMSLINILVDEESRGRLWGRYTDDHFAGEATNAIFKRLKALAQAGKEFPSLAVLAADPALPDSSRSMLKSTLSRVDRGLPLTRQDIKVNGKKVKTESSADYETHVFDYLEAFRVNRLTVEQFTEAIEKIVDNKNPLEGPPVADRVASRILQEKATSDAGTSLLNVGFGTDLADRKRRKKRVKNLFKSLDARLIKTGFADYDKLAGGHQPGEVIVLGANTGGGKSSYMFSQMVNMYHLGISSAMLQLELSEAQCDQRISANIANIDSNLIRTGAIRDKPKERKAIEDAWDELDEVGKANKTRMTVFTPPSATVESCEFMFRMFPYRVWFIDYINLMEWEGNKPEWEKLSEIVKAFKRMAKKYGIAVILAAQINIDKDSGLIDVRYSKAIKEHCDVFIAWNLTDEDRENGVVWVKHIKARQYEPFDFPLSVELKFCRFGNYSGGVQKTSNAFSKAAQGGKKTKDGGDGGKKFGSSNMREGYVGGGGKKSGDGGKKKTQRPQDELIEEMSEGAGKDVNKALRMSIADMVKKRLGNPNAKIHVPDDLDDDEVVEKPRKKKAA